MNGIFVVANNGRISDQAPLSHTCTLYHTRPSINHYPCMFTNIKSKRNKINKEHYRKTEMLPSGCNLKKNIQVFTCIHRNVTGNANTLKHPAAQKTTYDHNLYHSSPVTMHTLQGLLNFPFLSMLGAMWFVFTTFYFHEFTFRNNLKDWMSNEMF